jgi:GTPase SAR1 family protein
LKNEVKVMNLKDGYKIILSGLDNAGKTSMLYAIKKMYDFEDSLEKLKPTNRISYYTRNFINSVISILDMGGQKSYRDYYIKNKVYFEQLSGLLYLIDIQDDQRFTESIDYLGNILEILRENEYNKEIPINICFSKADFNLLVEHKEDYSNRIDMIQSLILKNYPDFKFSFHSTNIFNVYSIIHVLFHTFEVYFKVIAELKKTLELFKEINNATRVLLFDPSGMLIAEDHVDHKTKDALLLQNQINNYINQHLVFYKNLEDEHLEIMGNHCFDEDFSSYCFQFKPDICEKDHFYISIIYPKKIIPSPQKTITKLVCELNGELSTEFCLDD